MSTRTVLSLALIFGLMTIGPANALERRSASQILLDPHGLAGQPLLAQRSIGGKEDSKEPDARLEKDRRHRSPAVAGILSALVPGAGQLYNGNKLGYLFLGIEAASWVAYASMHSTGKQEERDYRRFADSHWTFERYRDPNSGPCPTNGHSDMGIQDSTLVFLYDTRRKDFYEDIGKLTIYFCGWDTQDNKDVYREMRENSNDFLRNARYATTLVFLNHLVAALQAARGAASNNARLPGGADLNLNISPGLVDPSAELALVRRF